MTSPLRTWWAATVVLCGPVAVVDLVLVLIYPAWIGVLSPVLCPGDNPRLLVTVEHIATYDGTITNFYHYCHDAALGLSSVRWYVLLALHAGVVLAVSAVLALSTTRRRGGARSRRQNRAASHWKAVRRLAPRTPETTAATAVETTGTSTEPTAATTVEPDPPLLGDLTAEEWTLIERSRLASAVQHYRTRTGCSLQEAKEAVDRAIERQREADDAGH